MPAEVIGLTGVPDAGDSFVIMPDERQAKEIAMLRQQKMRETELAKSSKLSLEQLYREKYRWVRLKSSTLLLKAMFRAPLKPYPESPRKLPTDAIRLRVINSSVGAITETDVNLATASNAIVLGFNVRPEVKAQSLAEKEGVDLIASTILFMMQSTTSKRPWKGCSNSTLKEKFLGRRDSKYSLFQNMEMLPDLYVLGRKDGEEFTSSPASR
ncbi:MAG: hypothetical protein MZV70_73570 [Desulfobacterales bacterium]|nr:hypothetical protein [Desulfobacterales bacterium]